MPSTTADVGDRQPVHVIHLRNWVDKADSRAAAVLEKYGEVPAAAAVVGCKLCVNQASS